MFNFGILEENYMPGGEVFPNGGHAIIMFKKERKKKKKK